MIELTLYTYTCTRLLFIAVKACQITFIKFPVYDLLALGNRRSVLDHAAYYHYYYCLRWLVCLNLNLTSVALFSQTCV